MRCFVGVLVLVGCASPRTSTGDGGIVASDAAVLDGAVGPTPPCATTVDIDGDGLGWECDPVEHISLVNAPHGLVWMRWLADTTFAVHVGFNCTGYSCTDHAAVEVRPDRAMIRRSDSGLPEDAWLKNAMVSGPCIDADQTAWWSASSIGKTGTIDPTGTFKPVVSSLIADCFPVGNTTALVGMSSQTVFLPEITQLASPRGGALHTFATADFGRIDEPNLDIALAPPILAAAGKPTLTTATLIQAHPGDLAPSEVIVDGAPATAVDSITKLDSSGLGLYEPPYAGSASARFYVNRSGTAYLVAITGTGVDWARLPRTDFTCSRWPNEEVQCTASDNPGTTLVVVRGSTVVPVFAHEQPSGGSGQIMPAGTAMQTIQYGPKIWVIDPANRSSVLAAGLANPRSAVHDDVALAVGVSAGGDLMLERYHTGTGREEIMIEHGVDQAFASTVILTAEGDAIVGGVDDTYVVQSTASVAAHLNLPNVGLFGFSRGDSTVVVAGSALYAYDELGPGPRLTMLVAPLSGLEAAALDPDSGAPTNYFAYGFFTQVARIIYTGTTPALVQAACVGMPSEAHLAGRDSNGIPIAVCGVDSESYVFELESTGPKAVAHFESNVLLYEDRRLAEHPIVAWRGQSVATHNDDICLASHAERCWRIPFSDPLTVLTHATTTMNVDSAVDTFSVLVEDIHPYAVDLWVLRPLGPGEEPQPLP